MTEIDLTPITRLEYDIDAILNDHAVAEPITRIELILADIVAGNTTTVEPVTRIETYLAIISGADYPVPEPVTRIETFLAIIAGEDYEEPEAVTRLEGLLAEWVEKGSGIWKTVTGTLIHITDALASPMQKCEVTLEPIQDLHGQDSPYPAGGGVNILDPNLKFTAGTYYGGVVLSTTDGYNFTLSGTPTGSGNIQTNAVDLEDAVILPAGTYITTAGTASIYSATGSWIRNQYSNTPFTIDQPFFIKNFYVEIVSGRTYNATRFITLAKGSTAPTEWSPYSNICPITGWTGCEVTRLGANILPYPYFDSSTTRFGITFTVNNDGTITVNGTASNDATFELCRTYPYSNDELVLGKTIKLTGCPQNGSQSTYYLSAVITGHKDTGNGVSFTINNVGYFRFAIVIKSGVTVNNLIFKPMIAISEKQQDYEPYSGTTLSVTFPDSAGTVYGGTVDLVSGLLKVEAELEVFNDVTNNGIQSQADSFTNLNGVGIVGDYTRIPFSVRTDRTNYNRNSNGYKFKMCNMAKHIYSYNDASNHWYRNTGLYVFLPTSVIGSTAQSVIDYLVSIKDTNPLSLWIPYNEPIEIQLTPQEISTLAGENNVWGDGDSVEITYKAQSS